MAAGVTADISPTEPQEDQFWPILARTINAAGATELPIRKHNGNERAKASAPTNPSHSFYTIPSPPSMMPVLEMGNGGGVIVTTTGGIARLIFLAKSHDSSLADSVADP